MAGYIIKYKNIVITIQESNKLGARLVGKIDIIHHGQETLDDISFENITRIYPYSGFRKFDLEEQLRGESLRRTLPRKIKESIMELPEVIAEMRDSKINDIIK